MSLPLPDILAIQSVAKFEQACLEIFRFQTTHCKIYGEYIRLLGIDPALVRQVNDIPFLPISFFKTHEIISNNQPPQITFTSSGTTGSSTSRHMVTDLSLYEKSLNESFSLFYGNPINYTFLALLPSYLERQGSSLVYMVEKLMEQSGKADNGFYLHNFEDLHERLITLRNKGSKVLLLGVTYALLDFAALYPIDFPELIVMETGGMKGKREELPRRELHKMLYKRFGVAKIHSEYGMTELLSQAYSAGDGIFRTPPWMQVRIRDQRDPLSYVADGVVGGINIIDLANRNSCAFIETQDLGCRHDDGNFEVLGRFAQSDVRGCNLMYEG